MSLPSVLPPITSIAVSLDGNGHILGSGIYLFSNNTGIIYSALSGLFYANWNPNGYTTGLSSGAYLNKNGDFSTGNFTFSGLTIFGNDVSITGTRVLKTNTIYNANGNNTSYLSLNASAWIYNGVGVVDFVNQFLTDSSNIPAVRWGPRWLVDSIGNASLEWDNRYLFDTGVNYSVDWGNRYLYDKGGSITIDWGNKELSGSWSTNSGFYISGYYALTTADASGYVKTGQTGAFITTGQTGKFLTSNGVTGISITGLTITGNVVISGLGGVAVTSSGQNILISGVSTGNFVTTGQTGSFATTGTMINIPSVVGQPSGNYTVDWRLSTSFQYSLTGNTQFIFTGLSNGQTVVMAVINTGIYTASWPNGGSTLPSGISGIKWPSGIAPTQSISGKTDVYTFVDINNIVYGNVIQGF